MTKELVYPASRLKAVLLFLGCSAFVAVGLLVSKEKPLIGWACVAFFGLGLPASVLMLLPNKFYLKLTPQGFEVRSLFGGKLTRWSDVERFYIGSIRGTKMIAIVYRASYVDQQALRKVSSAVAGMEGAVPNSYTSSRDEILKTLNEWHTRYGRAGA
jgi:hypothetical protein